MTEKKVLVVFGATGVQGGSVIRTILSSPVAREEFSIRGITRDPSKPTAQALVSQGVEVVAGDLDSKESVKKALTGAYAVFSVTNYAESMDAERETKQGITVADVCQEVGVKHLIWSTLTFVSEVSNGKYTKVAFFDSKARVDAHIKKLGIPCTFFIAGTYMSFFAGWVAQVPSADGPPSLITATHLPSTASVPLLDAANDTGKFIKAILLQREKTLGKYVFGTVDYYTMDEIMVELGEVFGHRIKESKYIQISENEHKANMAKLGLPPDVQETLVQSFKSTAEYGYFGKDVDILWSLSLVDDKLTTWKEWAVTAPAFANL